MIINENEIPKNKKEIHYLAEKRYALLTSGKYLTGWELNERRLLDDGKIQEWFDYWVSYDSGKEVYTRHFKYDDFEEVL